MRNHAFLKVVLLGLLTFALVPGIAAAGGGTNPIIEVAPGAWHYGIVNSGACAGPFTFTITNLGDADLIVANVSTSAPFSVAGGFTNGTIGIGLSATVDVDFCPTTGGYQQGFLTVESNAINGTPTFDVLLEGLGNTAPQFTSGFATVNFPVFVTTSETWTANDAEADPTSWSIAGLPPVAPGLVASATDGLGNSSATLEWTPTPVDVGTYPCVITISDGLLSTDSPSFDVVVSLTNTPPVSEPGGPYNGVRTVPITFDGSASTDPDGLIATYAWDFGDGGTATGMVANHAYAATGIFTVTLTVTDNGIPALSNSNQTTASISNFIPAGLTAKLTNNAIKTFGNGLQQIGAELSPVTGFNALDINPATLRLSLEAYPANGEISPVGGKGASVGDLDGDRLQELVVSFTRDGLATIAAGVPSNTAVVWVMKGNLVAAKGGAPIRATGTYVVKQSGGPGAVSSFAAPNPFNPETSISYTLRNQGTVSVRIYSVNGRLVRSLREEFANPGTFEVRWNGTDDSGRPVRSGMYFVNVVQGANESHTKVVVAK